MVERVKEGSSEFEAVVGEEGAAITFDFSKAEELTGGDEVAAGKGKKEGDALTGEVQTSEERAKIQSRSIVGLMDIAFKLKDSEHAYGDGVFRDGERHLSPALMRLNVNLPAFEFINAIMWLFGTSFKSIGEIRARQVKKKGNKEDAKPEHGAA